MTESIFPLHDVSDPPERDPEVVSFDEADAMIEALACRTARRLVELLSEDPMVPSDLAERADTSIQNATYHLDRLTEAGVVETVDTCYSSRGVEMDVYALASEPLVISFGDDGAVPRAVAAATETGLANSD